MSAGDFVNISAHRRHRVEWTKPDKPTIWLAVHYGCPEGATSDKEFSDACREGA